MEDFLTLKVIVSVGTLVVAIIGIQHTHLIRRHKKQTRTIEFIEDLNNHDTVALRERIDAIIRRNIDWGHVLDEKNHIRDESLAKEFNDMRQWANFFQILGAAYYREILDGPYTHDVFGGLVQKYHDEQGPFLEAMRRSRPTLYEDYSGMARAMRAKDQYDASVTAHQTRTNEWENRAHQLRNGGQTYCEWITEHLRFWLRLPC